MITDPARGVILDGRENTVVAVVQEVGVEVFQGLPNIREGNQRIALRKIACILKESTGARRKQNQNRSEENLPVPTNLAMEIILKSARGQLGAKGHLLLQETTTSKNRVLVKPIGKTITREIRGIGIQMTMNTPILRAVEDLSNMIGRRWSGGTMRGIRIPGLARAHVRLDGAMSDFLHNTESRSIQDMMDGGIVKAIGKGIIINLVIGVVGAGRDLISIVDMMNPSSIRVGAALLAQVLRHPYSSSIISQISLFPTIGESQSMAIPIRLTPISPLRPVNHILPKHRLSQLLPTHLLLLCL